MYNEPVSISRLMRPLKRPIPMNAARHDPSASRSSDFGSLGAVVFITCVGKAPANGTRHRGNPPDAFQDCGCEEPLSRWRRGYTRYWCMTISCPPSTRLPPTSLCDWVSIRNACSPGLPRILETSITPEDSSSLVMKFGPDTPGPLRLGSKHAGS